VRQAERLLGRNELPPKPFEPWELNLSLEAGQRLGDHVLTLDRAIAVRGAFRLGPIDVDLAPGERVSVTGRNGAGKSTLLGMLLGVVPLTAGERIVGGEQSSARSDRAVTRTAATPRCSMSSGHGRG
jgi:ABC-type molybdenum transport system ATPase subunit/photorepair protein PhrA